MLLLGHKGSSAVDETRGEASPSSPLHDRKLRIVVDPELGPALLDVIDSEPTLVDPLDQAGELACAALARVGIDVDDGPPRASS